MMYAKRTTRRRALALIALLLSVALPACEMPPASSDGAADGAASRQPYQPDPDAGVGALIHRIDMPLDVSLDACWAEVDEGAVPVLMHGLWQVNGLRIGILQADRAGAFAQALPVINGESRAKLFSSHYPTAVRSTPRLIEPVVVDLTVPPRNPTLYKARDGRLQMLVRIGRSETGQAFLEVTPHHYKPKPDLIPRSPLEKQLDGRVFRELSALLPISPDTAIVVGVHRPWPIEEPAEAESADAQEAAPEPGTPEAAEDEGPTGEAALSPGPPPIPSHLGRSLMTGTRAGHPTQIMMVISMIEDEPGDAEGPAPE